MGCIQHRMALALPPQPKYPCPNCRHLLLQQRQGQIGAQVCWHLPLCQLVQYIAVPLQKLRRLSHSFDNARGKVFQQGHNLMPHSIAQVGIRCVAGIFSPGLSCLLQGVNHFCLAYMQQRPQYGHAVHLRLLPHTAQAIQPGSPHQVHQQSFRLVFPMMSKHQCICATLLHSPLKGSVPCLPCPSFPRVCRRGQLKNRTRYVLLPAEVCHKGFVLVRRLTTQSVVHMHGFQHHLATVAKHQQHTAQCHGICPAGQAHKHFPFQPRKGICQLFKGHASHSLLSEGVRCTHCRQSSPCKRRR